MRIDCSELQLAFDDLRSLTGDNKQTTFAMLNFNSNGMEVCYTDNTSMYNRKIDGELEDGDTEFKAIVDIKTFITRLELFKTSGNIHLEPLSILADGDSLSLKSSKYLMVAEYTEDGELDVDEAGDYKTHNLLGMEVKTRIRFYNVSDNVKFSVTTRTPYEILYQPEGEGFAVIEKDWFIGLMDKLVKTLDSPLCAVSGKTGLAFSPGRSYTTRIPFDNTDVPTFGITSSLTVKIVNIFKRYDTDNIKLLVTTDKKWVKIVTEDEQLAMMVINTFPSTTALTSLSSYDQTEYSVLRMQFNKEMITNLVKGTLLVVEGGAAASKVKFIHDEDEDKMKMVISKKGSGSTEDDLQIIAENYSGDINTIKGTVLNVVFKLLDQALGSCEEAVVEIKLGDTGNTKVLRVADIERNVVTKETTNEKAIFYMCV